jgi:hypothetical protein
MNFEITSPAGFPFPAHTAGAEDGGRGGSAAPTVLEVPGKLDQDVYRDMRWCANCGGQQIFVEMYEFEAGRVGVCLGCGDERVVRFSREVA